MKKILLLIIAILSTITVSAQTDTPNFRVKYLSAENIYIDGGKADGMMVGDSLLVSRNGQSIAVLRVVYAADNSAACQAITSQSPIKAGDVIKPIRLHAAATAEKPSESRTRAAPRGRSTSGKSASERLRLSGSASATWYHFTDLSTARYNFNEPGLRLNMHVRNIFGVNHNFHFVNRGRYNMRTTRLSSRVPETEWRHRIYEVSLSYDDQSAWFNYKFGRIISNAFSGVGYIDGLLLQQNMAPFFRYGVFAGTQPEWQYSTVQTSLQKYGAFLNFSAGDYVRGRYEGTLAAAGEYHGATVSREFIYVQNSYADSRFNFYQSADIDINRDWRKERTGETISLTNLYVYANYKLSPDFTLGMSYDNRKNYYTYEIRSLADSLFDETMRYGLRGNLRWQVARQLSFFGNVGLRTGVAEQKNSLSYAAGLNAFNLTPWRLFFGVNGSGFSNEYSDGYSASTRLGKNFRAGHDLELAFGTFTYTLNAIDDSRQNQWARLNFSLQLPGSLYLTEQYEYSWGNDAAGHRVYSQLGYRF